MTKKQFCSTKIFGVMIYNTSFVISATQMQTSDTAFVLFCVYEWVIAQMGKTHPSGFTEKKEIFAICPHHFSNSLAKSKNPISSIILTKGSKKN